MARVWIVLQHRDGKLHRMAREAVAAGQSLAQAIGGTAEAVVLGEGIGAVAEEAASFDLGAVHVGDHANFASYTPGAYIAAVAPAIRAKPRIWWSSRTLTSLSSTSRVWLRLREPGSFPR